MGRSLNLYPLVWRWPLLAFVAALLALAQPVRAQDVPEKPSPPRLVNDFTNQVLSGQQAQALEDKLVDFNRATGRQLAVVVVPDMGGYEVEEYANALFNKWGIGEKGKDNGLLLLVALEERRMRIETGYGDEGGLPDVVARRIIDNTLKPAFRAGDYFGGIDQATTQMMAKVAPEYTPKAASPRQQREYDRREGPQAIKLSWWQKIFGVIIGIIILWAVIKNPWLLLLFMNSGGRRGGGGGWGDFSGGRGGFGGFGGGRSGGGGASGSW